MKNEIIMKIKKVIFYNDNENIDDNHNDNDEYCDNMKKKWKR